MRTKANRKNGRPIEVLIAALIGIISFFLLCSWFFYHRPLNTPKDTKIVEIGILYVPVVRVFVGIFFIRDIGVIRGGSLSL